MIWLRSVVYTVLLFLSIIPYAFAVIGSSLLGPTARFAVAAQWARLNLWMLAKLCGLTYSLEGLENIPDDNGVVYIKHQSVFETILPFTIFPIQSFVLKRELMWIPILGWALHFIRPIAIDRGAGATAVKQVVRQGRERLAEGRWIIIFPEGTRMAPGMTRRYGMSGALLAREASCRILPIAHNAGDFWPRRGLLKHPGNIQVIIGPAIEAAGKTPDRLNREAQTWIEGTMRKISGKYAESDSNSA